MPLEEGAFTSDRGTANTAFAAQRTAFYTAQRTAFYTVIGLGCRTCLSKRARLRRMSGTANTAFAAQRTALYTLVSRLIRGDAVGDAGEFYFACFAAFFGADDVEHAHVLVEIDAS